MTYVYLLTYCFVFVLVFTVQQDELIESSCSEYVHNVCGGGGVVSSS